MFDEKELKKEREKNDNKRSKTRVGEHYRLCFQIPGIMRSSIFSIQSKKKREKNFLIIIMKLTKKKKIITNKNEDFRERGSD